MKKSGLLLEKDGDGMKKVPQSAVALYELTIAESGLVPATSSSGLPLHQGEDGAENDLASAGGLYRCAVAEEKEVDAMFYL